MSENWVEPTQGGTSSDQNSFQVNLIKMILQADELYRRSQQVVTALANPTHPLLVSTRGIPFGHEALSCASYFLSAATNSLVSLRILTVEAVTGTEESPSVLANLTVHGTPGLIRQTLECAAKAYWIMNAEDVEQFSSRGFAAVWENARSAVAYAYAIDSPDLNGKIQVKSELEERGSQLGLTTTNRGVQPKYPFIGTTAILREIQFEQRDFTHLEPILGSKVHSGEWMYSWLSGMSHGMIWCHVDESDSGEESEMNLTHTSSDLMRLSLCLALAVQIIESTIDSLDYEIPV